MKIAFVYIDQRGKYLADALARHVEVVPIDLSHARANAHWFIKAIAAFSSFHFNQLHWRNDYFRSPVMLDCLKRIYRDYCLSEKIENIDAVIQFGLMFPCDFNVFNGARFFIYADGVYDPENKFWYAPRFGKSFQDMQKRIYESSNRAFTESQWAKGQLHQRYGIPLEKIVACGWGPCFSAPLQKTQKTENPKKFIFVGSGFKLKGIDILIEAFRAVRERFPDATLDIVGEDKPVDFNEPNVKFRGFCARDSVVEFLKTSDVFVLPSRYERSALVIPEAMAYGLPVITTNTCGTAEPVLSSRCGYVVEPGSVVELQNAMIRILQDPQAFYSMSENAVNAAFESWNWDAIARKILKNVTA